MFISDGLDICLYHLKKKKKIQCTDILWCNQQIKSINTQRKKIVCLNLLREKETKRHIPSLIIFHLINHCTFTQ